MGFTAVWISPISLNVQGNSADGEAYHGYWQTDINSLNPAFGTTSDLQALSSAVHSRGMYLMADVVVNNMAWNGAPNTIDYSQLHPFNDQSFYHSFCAISEEDFATYDANVQNCWLGDTIVSLPDLDSNNPAVQSEFNSWIQNLISTYSCMHCPFSPALVTDYCEVDGLRLDGGKHVPAGFFSSFNDAAGVYSVAEYYDGNQFYTCGLQNSVDGVMNYPLYFPLTRALLSTSGNITELVNMQDSIKNTCPDSTLLGSFTENQDQPRLPAITSDNSLIKNTIIFSFLGDGIPIAYAGQEQRYTGADDPYNREAIWLSGYSETSEFYRLYASLNQIRNVAIATNPNYLTYKAWIIYSDDSVIAMRKGDPNQMIIVVNNQGSGGASYTLSIGNTGFTSGETVLEILTCTTVTVDGSGNLPVQMGQGVPKVSQTCHS
ncbi:MAG: hypothetical protein Q9160_000150 [Pyrenula sp. 1 TL-2023]